MNIYKAAIKLDLIGHILYDLTDGDGSKDQELAKHEIDTAKHLVWDLESVFKTELIREKTKQSLRTEAEDVAERGSAETSTDFRGVANTEGARLP